MTGEWFSGGVFLVKGPRAYNTPNATVEPPNTASTVSDCIVDLVPQAICFLNGDNAAPESLIDALGCTEEAAVECVKCGERLLAERKLGLPSVFADMKTARSYRDAFLQHMIDQVRMREIAIPGEGRSAYMRNLRGSHTDCSVDGVYLALEERTTCDLSSGLLGFDVLAWDHMTIHTFCCNYLQEDYRSQLGIELNNNGLIASYEDAKRAAEFTNREETGAEPGLWLAWAVIDRS